MIKEYPLDTDIRRTILTWAFLILGLREILMIIMLFFGNEGTDVDTYLMLLIGFAFALYYIILAYTERIIVSPTDITFQMVGLLISIKWQDVESIRHTKFLGVRYDAIFAPKDKATIKGFPVYGEEVSINLHRYSDNWRESELGQQIKQYAPHLFR